MRNYQILDVAVVDQDNVLILSNSEENPEHPLLAMSREGSFISLSASFGPLEVALRLRADDLLRRIERLHPVAGLATTRQVGTANSFIAIGITSDNRLVLRPTIVADASGKLTFNLVTTQKVYNDIVDWLNNPEA
ncbi:MAG: hypothetical protein CUN55_10315 [Phototrophicales bacterium]|nr:MAG: hypothetical protein CUN55_10315 [Phototrophicales bacterium]